MRYPGIAFSALLLAATLGSACLAAAPATTDTTTTRLDALHVSATSSPWGESALSDGALRDRRGDNLAENLEQLPGVAAVRRAPSAAEPVIRGLGWERVQTILGAVPLYGACPGRMDPPATYLSALSTESVTVFRQGGGAFGGPGGTGGTILAKPDYERQAGDPNGVTPWLGAGYESARDGFRYEGGLFGGSDRVDYKLGMGHRDYDDYTAPDGTVVPAGQTTTTASGSLGWRPRDGQRLWYATTYTHEENIDFPALPMDNIDTDFQVHNLGWRTESATGLLRGVEITGGVSLIDHLMDNSLKPNRGAMEAATEAETRSGAAHAVFDLRPSERWRIRTGLDLTRLTRDAIRTRFMVDMDLTFHDRLWPDASQTSGGGFADLTRDLSPTMALTLGGRVDAIDSKARAADDASLGGLTVREQYVNYYGDDAAETDRSETLGALQLKLAGEAGAGGQWYVRTGLSTRPAGITERYYAFGPAPGGYQVGDPTLNAEQKWEGEAGGRLAGEQLALSVSVFHAKVTDFILATEIDRRDVNGDGIDDTIKGFENTDAALTGGELGLEYHPIATLYVPVTLSFVRGRNTTADRDLPEMPPLFGTAEVRWLAHGSSASWLSGGCYFAADQAKIDPLFPEDRTGGYTVWYMRLESSPVDGWRFGVRVDNLFDKLYNDHLTREAVLPVGDLAAGQEVPAPGRSLTVTAHLKF